MTRWQGDSPPQVSERSNIVSTHCFSCSAQLASPQFDLQRSSGAHAPFFVKTLFDSPILAHQRVSWPSRRSRRTPASRPPRRARCAPRATSAWTRRCPRCPAPTARTAWAAPAPAPAARRGCSARTPQCCPRAAPGGGLGQPVASFWDILE